jgi:uncharacterized Zn finger protein (UPF0148 family)
VFENLLRELGRLDGAKTEVSLPLDEDGYLDRECPNDECQFQFKIYVDDWKNICRDEEVFCPMCRHAAPAKSWHTTEQVEKINNTARSVFGTAINRAMRADADAWNRRQSLNSFIKITMCVKSSAAPIVLPISAADPMRQKATCTQCQCRYSYIGSAFFCPSCGENSAEQTFAQSLNAIRVAVSIDDKIRSVMDRHDAEVSIRLLREKGINDAVMAFQRLAERLYTRICGASPPRRNIFQRLEDGDRLWQSVGQQPYSTLLTTRELTKLTIYFQQRHLLSHCEGIVDADYVAKSGDTTYQIGQHLLITQAAILDLVELIEKLGNGLIRSAPKEK